MGDNPEDGEQEDGKSRAGPWNWEELSLAGVLLGDKYSLMLEAQVGLIFKRLECCAMKFRLVFLYLSKSSLHSVVVG